MTIPAFSLFSIVVGVLAASKVDAASSSKLFVRVPRDLNKPDGYDHKEALFGIPPYGGSIMQPLIYADSNLCNPNVDKRKGFPARPLNSNGQMQPWESPFILMTDRGGCTFVTKVRNAQKAGAAAVVVADNNCMCLDTTCLNQTDMTGLVCEEAEPIMADDGSGSDVSIPSFLMYRHDAEPIIKTLKRNTPVHLEMQFNILAPDNHVEYELWTRPFDAQSHDFLSVFEKAAAKLGADAAFTPHEFVIDGESMGCRQNGTNVCFDMCTNAGRYCNTDPDQIYGGATGGDMVAESLRRLCVWKIYGESNGIGPEWWSYVNAFSSQCERAQSVASSLDFHDPKCTKIAMEMAKVDELLVDKCIADSGGLEGDVENDLLKVQVTKAQKENIMMIPQVNVNKSPLRGALELETVFLAVCAGYALGFEPDICTKCDQCVHHMSGCIEHGRCGPGRRDSTGVSFSVFVSSFAGLSVFFVIVGYVMYRRQQAQLQEVRGIMAEYMPVMKATGDNSLGLEEYDDDEGEFTIS